MAPVAAFDKSSDMTLTQKHGAILIPGTQVRLTRATLDSKRPSELHDHDFCEIFWVQNGTVRHHLPSGKTTLTEGEVVMLRPGQTHAVQGRGEAAMVVSLCLHPELTDALAHQNPALSGQFFWTHEDTPQTYMRDIRQMAALNRAAVQLEQSKCDKLAGLSFLLPLLSDLLPLHALPADAPDWLIAACDGARDPQVFRDGAAGLIALTGRAHPHVARTMRRFLGQSPSEYINGLRMDHAARLLTTDSDPLPDIAQTIGLPNLSHFHKLFRVHHGMTPLQYRQQYQRDVVQPR